MVIRRRMGQIAESHPPERGGTDGKARREKMPVTNEATVQRMSEAEVRTLARRFLEGHGLNAAQSDCLARILSAAERDGSLSHGLQRLPGTLETMAHPRFNKSADPQPEGKTAAFTQVDADFGFACLGAERGLDRLIASAKDLGIGLLAVRNGFHSTALWPLIERIAGHGLVALSMNPTHAWVAPAGGSKGLLGTNPIAFGWPRPDQPPYLFDFATTAAARADIALARDRGQTVPVGWGLDPEGEPTTDPAAILAGKMLPFGGHKGSALATMIELMAGPMIGDMSSKQSMEFDQGARAAPCHGELFIAFSPELIGGSAALDEAEQIFAGFAAQGARLPGSRRYTIRDQNMREGIPVSRMLLERIPALAAGSTLPD